MKIYDKIVKMPNILDVNWLQTLTTHLSDRKGFLFSFLLGFIIRLIPEILSYPYPIGFDTVYYAVRIKNNVVWYHWTSIFSTWLLDAILISVHTVTQIDQFFLLKVTAPVLHALNACAIFYFSRKALDWDLKKALIGVLLFAFQMASLRLSWDLYRNYFGLAIMLFILPLIKEMKTKSKIVLLSLAVVFTHLLVSAVFFAVVFGIIINDWMKERKIEPLKFATFLPALAVFLVSLYFFPAQINMEKNVIDTVQPSSSLYGIFFLTDYMNPSGKVHLYASYWDLVSRVFSLFGVLYLLSMPLILVGFFRHKVLDFLSALFLIGSFNSIITPFCALNFWNRWMYMLVYPFTFYAVNGIMKGLRYSTGKSAEPNFRWIRWIKVSRRMTLGILTLVVLLGLIFMTAPLFLDGFSVFSIPTTASYVPSTMLYNTIPLADVNDTIEVLQWLNVRLINGSGILVHHAFLSWAELYLDKKPIIVNFLWHFEDALDLAFEHNLNPLYLIWWNEDIGWYNLTIPNSFAAIFNSKRVSIYQYNNNQ